MTPARQFAESVKYTARPVILIPFEGSFIIMESYSFRRDYICTIPAAELAVWATDDFTRQRSRKDRALATERSARSAASIVPELNLGNFSL